MVFGALDFVVRRVDSAHLVHEVDQLVLRNFPLERAALGVRNNNLLKLVRLVRLHSLDVSQTDAGRLTQYLVHNRSPLLGFLSCTR